MADHLMSVRFDEETLRKLRTLAEVHDTNVAEEVRTAVRHHIDQLRDDEAFRQEAFEATRLRQERVKELLGLTEEVPLPLEETRVGVRTG